jgi:IS5 family transposase
MRDISRNLSDKQLETYKETFALFTKVTQQKMKDSHKLYTLHEQHIIASLVLKWVFQG